MDLHIRELTAPDLHRGFLEALAALTEVALTPQEAIPILQHRLRAGVRTFIAVHCDRVVGTASLFIEPKFIHRGGKVGHIEDVAVHRDFQRRGIGTALVQHATEEARKLGCYKVILYCFDHLVPFYARLGYRPYNAGLRLDLG
ncbi:MAG: GNAT family N-acetyltransferase [Gemmataceae bacterium]|nr:GNAT family N-acetyltransferase [Gemmataceae bacterium]MDW8265828.1 GNAT family N-acetyltransferase [Gemmataceae bacterium]